ncbi:hypothetical protein M1145_02750 [Patescibacteria group bacterium]|nr:hypothetical protein [Patescibacteria group bacterium]
MNLNKLKQNLKYIGLVIAIFAVIAIVITVVISLFHQSSTYKQNKPIQKNISARQYYAKKAPQTIHGFSIDVIGKSIFVTIFKPPCSYYKDQAITYLNSFAQPKSSETVYFLPQGNSNYFTSACYKTYTLK